MANITNITLFQRWLWGTIQPHPHALQTNSALVGVEASTIDKYRDLGSSVVVLTSTTVDILSFLTGPAWVLTALSRAQGSVAVFRNWTSLKQRVRQLLTTVFTKVKEHCKGHQAYATIIPQTVEPMKSMKTERDVHWWG